MKTTADNRREKDIEEKRGGDRELYAVLAYKAEELQRQTTQLERRTAFLNDMLTRQRFGAEELERQAEELNREAKKLNRESAALSEGVWLKSAIAIGLSLLSIALSLLRP